MKDRYYLPINLKKEAHLTFHLIMLLRDDLYPWFYENFVNIFIRNDKYAIMDFVDNADESFKFLIDEQISYSHEEIESTDYNLLIREKLNNNFYTAVWVDKYFIPGAVEYHKDHFVHPIIIYGYDNLKEIYTFFNFSWDKGIVTNQIKYDELREAIHSAPEYAAHGGGATSISNAIICFRQKANYSRKTFQIEAFLEEFKNYICSQPGKIRSRNQFNVADDAVYGLQVYDYLIHLLQNIDKGKDIAFKSLADFVLHKQYLFDRLIYIKDHYQVSEKCCDLITQFSKVIALIMRLKLLNIKYATIDHTNPASLSHNSTYIKKAIKIIQEAKDIENNILPSIYVSLSYDTSHIIISDGTEETNIISHEINFNSDNQITVNFPQETIITQIDFIQKSSRIIFQPIGLLEFDNGMKRVIPAATMQNGIYNSIHIEPSKISGFTYSPYIGNEGSLTDISFCIYGITNKKTWDFAKNIYYNLAPSNDISEAHYENGYICSVIGRDPNITCNSININADKSKYIYINYISTCNSEVSQLFFDTVDNQELDEDNSKIITISPNDNEMEYIYDMSGILQWQGVIKSLRFDPTGYDNAINGECKIKYIKVSDIMPTYNSRKHYCKNQGVNGWFYYTYNNGITYREMKYDNDEVKWKYHLCPELYINTESQNSYNHMATVRRFVCPADGTYRVSYSVQQLSDGWKSAFTVKRNHHIVDQKACTKNTTYANRIELNLEYGEMLNFEFYNANENTTEIIEVDITIDKIENSIIN